MVKEVLIPSQHKLLEMATKITNSRSDLGTRVKGLLLPTSMDGLS